MNTKISHNAAARRHYEVGVQGTLVEIAVTAIAVVLIIGFAAVNLPRSACAADAQLDAPPVIAEPWDGEWRFGLEPICQALVGKDIAVGIGSLGDPTFVQDPVYATRIADGSLVSVGITAYHFNMLDRGLGYVILMTEHDSPTIIGYAGSEPVDSGAQADPPNPFGGMIYD